MNKSKPTRTQSDLAEMLELLLDKGVVVNADVAVSIGETELLGIELRATIASFETAAEYGLEFPTGTDMERVEKAADVTSAASETNPDAISRSGTTSEDDPMEEEQSLVANPSPQERE